jgi:soluble lytic murein transglycosylase
MKPAIPVLAGALVLAVATSVPRAQNGPALDGGEPGTGLTVLAPTAHPALPRDLSQVWLAPAAAASTRAAATPTVGDVARLFARADYVRALSIAAQSSLESGPLALYAAYYTGLSQLRLSRAAEALQTFKWIQEQKPVGFLLEASQAGEAEASLALDKPGAAVAIYERLLSQNPSNLEDLLMRLGRAAKADGDRQKAADAFARVYYEFALSDLARAAGTELALLEIRAATSRSTRFKLELGRAERLYTARRYADARAAYEALRPLATGEDRELAQLRLAECDYRLGRFRPARIALAPLAQARGKHQAEALYFYGSAARSTGDKATFLKILRRVIDDFGTERWAEEALNSLGTFYIREDQDDLADGVFRELYEKFPQGAYAERAAWKIGWRAYRAGQYQDTVRFFERAAGDFPRSDYRPSWLYWAGRAHEKLADGVSANRRYALVLADYMNSYYGRLAANRVGPAEAAAASRAGVYSSAGRDIPLMASIPPNADTIRALLSVDMYDDALNELRYARRVWGDSPSIQATVAWTNHRQSRSERGMSRFQLARGAINIMRRAYPQFMAAGGENLPPEILTVIFPVEYWDLLRRYSAQNGLDLYLVAALVAQESTFVPDVRSHANAYGLMQLLPSTARQYARKLKLPYSLRLLTDPEANIRMGTAYLADKMKEFGQAHLALASYNAGESAVRQWMAERQGIDVDEFIDDIPYPETQGYVRKILGTAEDYRRLYGVDEAAAAAAPAMANPPTATEVLPAGRGISTRGKV